MSAEALLVEKRETTGTLRIRRLRKEGKVPAVLYGHGQDNVNLVVDSRAVSRIVDHGHYVVSLSGAVNDTAMIKEVQWDAFGSRILHIDLARVDASETIEASLPLHMKGEAPGAGLGGMVTQLAHELKITCPANMLPDFLEVSIDELQLDGSISASEIALPEGAALVGNPAETVISCPPPKGAAADGDEDAPSEPEVIGESKEDAAE
ncbi:50S ribosomal protein L25 [Mariniblastus fucicola]|uniref:Large ribosomal subunit protein bL25 n=1 Tax=Mariniblastus fucicola TaxID=980251 RepID=A0A5B9P846_9BACT|nr:50S ribosomal protein L25 [Mariniblastus fucicola]QEG22504.1 50S ribosomal protein L25 [Mariniblastus fucicola]